MDQILGPLLQRAAAELGSPEQLRRALAVVLERAARRAVGGDVDIEVDVEAGTLSVVVFRSVVDRRPEADEIELQEARAIDPDAQLGDELGCAVDLDTLAPHLRGALLVPAEQYPALELLLGDLLWDLEVVRALPRRPAELETAVARLLARLRSSVFAPQLRPGCDAVEIEAHEMMLGGSLPLALRQLLAGTAGMEDVRGAPRLSLGRQGFRLLSPLEAQQEHAEWTQRRDEVPPRATWPAGVVWPAQAWNADWLPIAVGSRGAEPTDLLVVDPIGAAADQPGELLCVSFEEAGWWALGIDITGLAHVWLMLRDHGLLEYRAPGVDPIATAKAEALVQHLMPRRRWVDAG
jgi:NusA N-terminal domain